MILRELSVERFTFTCSVCRHRWDVDYNVQHVEDGHGHQHDYYFRDGLPATDPGVTQPATCPNCGDIRVQAARLSARGVTPAVRVDSTAATASTPSAARTEQRSQVPPLPGAQGAAASDTDRVR
jgi:hypothetical protein